MRIQDIIAKKRDRGGALSAEEIAFFVDGYTSGTVADYQAAALLMAIYIQGMDDAETESLTAAMANSGGRLDLSALPTHPVLDKHSTGGVGDKTSLIVVPLLGALGIPICKMSGRGLGHTGGTLDKLESIPGFRIALTAEEMIAQVGRIGACLVGQTADLAPADRKLYALRDATATVGSIPLIVSSILSKKLAGGADIFLFDVKVGSGALLSSEAEMRALAEALVRVAGRHGKCAVCLLTDMSQPLGRCVGNALEVREAIDLLTPGPTQSSADPRLRDLCLHFAGEAAVLAGKADAIDAGIVLARTALEDGNALRVFREIVSAQGGDTKIVDDPSKIVAAPVVRSVPAAESGYIASIDATVLGNLVTRLGGGRLKKEDPIDYRVGLTVNGPIGAWFERGQSLAEIHAATDSDADWAVKAVQSAYTMSEQIAVTPPLVIERIASDG